MNTTIKLSLLTTLILSNNLIAEEKLEDITVTSATKTTQKLSDVTSNINVITSQEIEERHYTTVTEALNSLPGVSYTSNGGLGKSTSLRLRGFDAKRVLVLIDGIRQNDVTSTSGAPFSDLIISDIEQIEVIKGAQSGIWGADATAGVINIITKKAKEGVHGYASQEFGKFNTSKTDLGLSYANETFYLKTSQTRLDSDGFSAQHPKGTALGSLEDDAYKNTSSRIKAGVAFTPTNKLDVAYSIIKSHNNYDGATPNALDEAQTKDRFSSVNFNHLDSFNELNLYAKKSTFSRQSNSTLFNGETTEYGINSKIPYLSDSFVLVGGDYKKFNHDNNLNKEYSNKAGFITNHNKFQNFLGSTIVTESLRYDAYSSFKNKTTGKVGVKQTFSSINDLSLASNYGTAYNVPTPYQLYQPGSTFFGTFYPIGNENLIPETTKSVDVTLQYQDFTATYFNNKINNLIDYTNGYNNLLGTARIRGYELAYDTTFADVLALNVGYTRTEAKDAEGSTLLRRAGKSLKFGIDYYGVEDLHLGVNGEYVGDRKDKDFSSFPYADVSTGNYTVANFTANYDIDKHLSFYGKVDNITDKDYQTAYGYATSPRAAYAGMKLTY